MLHLYQVIYWSRKILEGIRFIRSRKLYSVLITVKSIRVSQRGEVKIGKSSTLEESYRTDCIRSDPTIDPAGKLARKLRRTWTLCGPLRHSWWGGIKRHWNCQGEEVGQLRPSTSWRLRARHLQMSSLMWVPTVSPWIIAKISRTV